MARVLLNPAQCVLLVVDVQPSLMSAIFEAERVRRRIGFLAGIAQLLDIPVFATEQNPSRMGQTEPGIREHVERVVSKMSFSCCASDEFNSMLASAGRRQVVIVGVETHICVGLTANELLVGGYEVVVCPDGVSARDLERHKLGMERIRDAGAVPAHTESVAYEWLRTAAHPRFKEALAIVKRAV